MARRDWPAHNDLAVAVPSAQERPLEEHRNQPSRVYSVLEVPKSPWQQTPYSSTNIQLLWTDVLDYACRWASFTNDRDDAAAQVTRGVYELGPAIVQSG